MYLECGVYSMVIRRALLLQGHVALIPIQVCLVGWKYGHISRSGIGKSSSFHAVAKFHRYKSHHRPSFFALYNQQHSNLSFILQIRELNANGILDKPCQNPSPRKVIKTPLRHASHQYIVFFGFCPLFLPFSSNDPSVTGVSTSRLRLPDDLDHLRSPQAQVLGHRVVDPDTRQLCLLQAVSAKQVSLLFRAEQHVLGHELVLADVDQQVVFLEDF